MKNTVLIVSIILALACGAVFAQTTEFTYQGSLKDGANQATGNYDFEFALFDSAAAGAQLGSAVTRNGVAVASGLFSVRLDFGNQFPGANRYLEIRVRPTGQPGMTTMAPRQLLTGIPYAVKSLSADSATNAANATNATNAVNATTATNALQLGGVAASQYVLTGDPRLSDARNPLPNSANYIQNSTLQTAGNFNIAGNGTVSAALAANIFNANTQYNIGGNRVLSIAGADNIFVGRNAGVANTTGNSNAFFGWSAGVVNSTGTFNLFAGANAGSFSTAGTYNSFVGANSGLLNTIGTHNTLIGSNVSLGANNLNYATAIGADSSVLTNNTVVLGRNLDTVQIPGNLNLTGSFTGSFTVPAANIAGILSPANGGSGLSSPGASGSFLRSNGTNWTSSALQAADVPDLGPSYVKNTTDPQTGNFNISGSGTANILNAATQFNIGGNRILAGPAGDNVFAGRTAGINNTSGIRNSFFGNQAGEANTGGSSNSFFGERSGLMSQGINNSFIGAVAGQSNVSGGNNTIVGTLADVGAPNLNFATAVGAGAVVSASNTVTLGRSSDTVQIPGAFSVTGPASFGGTLAANIFNATTQYNIGGNRMLSAPGSQNIFAGEGAGGSNTFGSNNAFFGTAAGAWNETGTFNTALGWSANVQSANLTYATAIGAGARVFTSNTVVLGTVNDAVKIPGELYAEKQIRIGNLGTEPFTCGPTKTGYMFFNSQSNRLKFCDGALWLIVANQGSLSEGTATPEQTQIDSQQKQIEAQQKQIEQQRKQIESLTEIVCAIHSKADICRK